MKLFKHILVVSVLILSAFCSCSKVEEGVSAEEFSFSYSISLPEVKSVTADGVAVNKVWYALYNLDGTLATKYAPVEFENGRAKCEVVMMRERSYRIVFVAQYYKDSATPTYPIDEENAVIGIPESPIANSDKMDLFYGVDEVISYNGTPNGSIVLDRVVAMVNFICTDEDWEQARNNGITPTHSSIVLSGVSTQFNLYDGTLGTDKTDLTFARSEIPSEKHVGAAFCLANAKVTATLNLYNSSDETAAPTKTLTVTEVQVEKNKKSNITGNIITE